jgi:type II secretory pathway predicted ATPase ExeA
MYHSHFELHRLLFQGGDRVRHFFRSQSICEIQPRLLRMLRGSLGPGLLTARQGAGRTALLRQLRAELEHDGRAVVVSGAALDSTAALLNLLLHAAMRPSAAGSDTAVEKPELTYWTVMQQLQKSVDFWGPVFLLLDDAHLMATGVMNELRALSEEEWQGRGLVRILVTAPLSFEMDLNRVEYTGLAQRICCHEILEPLTVVESLELLRLEIEAAGGRADRVLTESAAALVASASDGLPRQLSLLASETLAVAAEQGIRPADEDCARKALRRLQHLPLSWNPPVTAFSEELPEAVDGRTSPVFDFDAVESAEQKGGVFGVGVVEIGGPGEFAYLSAPGVVEELNPAPAAVDEPASETSVFEPEFPEPAEPLAAVCEPEESFSFWNPEHADLSSAVPVPARGNSPLNIGLISADSDWDVSHASLSAVSVATGPPIPEISVADNDVLMPRSVAETPARLMNDSAESVAGSSESLTGVKNDEDQQVPDDPAADDLFRAFSGRRLKSGSGNAGERQAELLPDTPVSLPLWRDGLLYRQPAVSAEHSGDASAESLAGIEQPKTPVPESPEPPAAVSDTVDAEMRFATLFTRLRRLQADSNPLNVEPGYVEPG